MIAKADAFEAILGELSEAIEVAREGDRDDLINLFEDVSMALGILNRRLSKLEADG